MSKKVLSEKIDTNVSLIKLTTYDFQYKNYNFYHIVFKNSFT